MKTESINEMLDRLYNKDSYSVEDLNAIDTIRINRLDIDGELLEVNFEDLLLFSNIKYLYIENCIIDSSNIDYIVNNNVENWFFINCDIVEDISSSLEKMTNKNLLMDNVDINLALLSNINFKSLTLRGMTVDNNVNLNSSLLDIQKCDILDLSIFESELIDTIVMSYSLYKAHKELFDSLEKKIIVMENNGQFEYKRVGC